jgi:hypothetical protein
MQQWVPLQHTEMSVRVSKPIEDDSDSEQDGESESGIEEGKRGNG